MIRIFSHEAHQILVPWPGITPETPALEGKVLVTGPPRKYHLGNFFFSCFYLFIWLRWVFIAACGIKVPDQGSNLGPLRWEHGTLPTRPPWKSLTLGNLKGQQIKVRVATAHNFNAPKIFGNIAVSHASEELTTLIRAASLPAWFIRPCWQLESRELCPSSPWIMCLASRAEGGLIYTSRAAVWWSGWKMASLDCGAFLCLKEEWFLQELRGGVLWNAGCPWRRTHVNADNVRRWPGTGQDGPSGRAERGQPLLMLQGTQEPLWYTGRASTFSPPHFIIQKGTSFFNNQLFSLSCYSLKRKCRILSMDSPLHNPTPPQKVSVAQRKRPAIFQFLLKSFLWKEAVL